MKRIDLYRNAAEYHGSMAEISMVIATAEQAGFHATLAAHFASLVLGEEFRDKVEVLFDSQ